MTTNRGNAADAIAGLLREGLRHIQGRGDAISETATLDLLIKPTLEALGYPPTYRFPEYGWLGNRLDESCFLQEVDAKPGQAAIIVEAKQYGVDFDKAPAGQVSANSPDQQIQRYLRQHKASGPNTFGVLTDGAKWRIYRRAERPSRAAGAANPGNPDIEFLAEYNFLPLAHSEPALLPDLLANLREQLTELVNRLFRENIAYGVTNLFAAPPPDNLADGLFSVLANTSQPDAVLRQMLGAPDAILQSREEAPLTLTGLRQHTHDYYWGDYHYSPGLPLKTDNPALFAAKAVVAAVQIHNEENPAISRPEAALAARAFAAVDPSRTAVVLAYSDIREGGMEARLAVAANGQVNMTAAFDPTLAAPSARAAADQLLQLLHQPPAGGLTAEQLMLPLEASQLRQQFYREIARWTDNRQAGKDRPQREAILRHLVRVMFAWILKEETEESIIPPELFEQAFANAVLPLADDYHREILRFLFHERLNVPGDKRGEHPNARINGAMEPVRFLNGSLFARHDDDDALDIPAAAYWSSDSTDPGLFTILSRYHWTMDEHRPGESEQTLDPELLSNLFERLITPTVEGTAAPLKQPQGTYYTPADVADEMVKDALAAAVRGYAPDSVSDAELLELFGSSEAALPEPSDVALAATMRDYAPDGISDAELLEFFGSGDAALPQLSDEERGELAQRIKGLRIFDPAVGSGAFLFSALLALQRALGKLEPYEINPAEDIIKNQLSGQDINPLAVQITRLRLFIAITADRRNGPSREEPLPNLEARIVCADTLATVANPEWRPERPSQLTDALPELTTALAAAAANRAEWYDAHPEEAKQKVLAAESRLRDELDGLLQSRAELASPELRGFARSTLYDATRSTPPPATTDARLLFYENPWRGFDIVIGNPPYTNVNAADRKELESKKGYRTTKVGDTYPLFCETALALANPEGGVITMIVPLSLAFGQSQQSLRDLFNQRCRQINLRHYDNRPDTPFNASPTVKSPENRQRVSVFTAVLGKESELEIIVKSSGLQRWPAAERSECLTHRAMTVIPRLGGKMDERVAGQWLRVPTPEVAKLVAAIGEQDQMVMDYEHPLPNFRDEKQLQGWLEKQGVAATAITGIKDWFQAWPYDDLTGLRYIGFTAADQVERLLLPSLVNWNSITRQQANEIKSWYNDRPDLPEGLEGVYLAWPQTAYQFIGVIPAGTVYPRRETRFRVKDMDDLRMLMAALNGHVGFSWWFVVGDGFDMKPVADHGTLTVPNFCSKNPERFIEMGQRLLDAMPECTVVNHQQGNDWQNVNFHQKPALIEEIDRLHLGALGFAGAAQDKVLGHLRIMRSSSSWRFGG